MSEQQPKSMYFTGLSEPVKIDDKRRITVPKSIYHGEDTGELIVVRATFNQANVLAITEADPFFAAAEADDNLVYVLPFARPVTLHTQSRFGMSKAEADHINSEHVIACGLGRVALIASEAQKDTLIEGFEHMISGTQVDCTKQSPLLSALLKATKIAEKRTVQ